jgi:molybdopterin-guanine dinucleotide biosynthesis protein A
VRLLGAVLAGGLSRRFGRDKSMELVAGVPMLHRAVHTVSAVADDVVVISSKALEVPQGIEVIPDVRPGLGPLGGLHTALLEAEVRQLRGVLLLACDLPLVTERVIAAIVARAGMSLAVAPTRTGGVEPLCAVYGCGALPLVVERLDGSDLSLHSLFRALNGCAVDLSSLGLETDASFLNVNTPEELLRARSYQEPG